MAPEHRATLLCFASYEKGHDFMRAAHEMGARVLLLTRTKLRDVAWPREAIDETFYMDDMYDRRALVEGISYLARSEQIDRIVALDDFDVEHAAAVREHLRLPGMGDSAVRFFRDKLAMRKGAEEAGIPIPTYVATLNDALINEFAARVAPPWFLKPRSEASAIGIRKIVDAGELWPAIEALGERRPYFLLEQYIAGDVYHVDSLLVDGKPVFIEAHRYAEPLFDVMHGGGIFITKTLPRDGEEAGALERLTVELLTTFGMQRGASHTEWIRSADGTFYFLETSARVGGANIVDLVEGASGINLWREWAAIEIAAVEEEPYVAPPARFTNAGLIVCLARQEHPDLSSYDAPEVVWRMNKPSHAGLVVASRDPARVEALLDEYRARFATDFHAVLPVPDRPPA